MKLYSWNVNGIRAVVKKGTFQTFMAEHQPDILCLQETKAEQGQAVIDLDGYNEYWNSSRTKKGYSGTAIFTRTTPVAVINDIPDEFIKSSGLAADGYGDANMEGRVIAAEFEDFYVVTAYTPNAKDDLTRIPLREKWDAAMTAYCAALNQGKINMLKLAGKHGLDEMQGDAEKRNEAYQEYAERASEATTKQLTKPVLYCGDMNVAHTELDLANPKPNVGKKGFTAEERSGFDNWLAAGFTDVYRQSHEGNGHYTWWSHFANSRARNVGWRIDYWLASKGIADKVNNPKIHPDIMGSDHCPVSIEVEF